VQTQADAHIKQMAFAATGQYLPMYQRQPLKYGAVVVVAQA
jgi:hypothetical protein